MLDPDRLFPIEDKARSIARSLYEGVRSMPIISPLWAYGSELVCQKRTLSKPGSTVHYP